MRKDLVVVIIDDNPADSNLVYRLLQKIEAFPVVVEIFAVYEEGLRRLQREDVDCLLLDLHLGAISGLELLQRVREMGLSVPIVMLTGQGNETLAAESIQEGAQGYLPKDGLTPQILQKTLTDAIRRAEWERLEQERHQELEQFVSIASHDMRRPLRHIYFYLQMLKEEIGEKLSPEGQYYFDVLEQTLMRSRELLQDLLELTRLGHGQTTWHDVDLNTLLENVVAEHIQNITDRNVQLDIATLPSIYGEPTQIFQLFDNLLSNAIKYADKSPPVIRISATSTPTSWLIQVQDNGPGIPTELSEKIFQPFYRITRENSPDGTGLGLSICHKVVRHHQGRIWVESRPGQGSTFMIEWPTPLTTRAEVSLLTQVPPEATSEPSGKQ